MLDSMRESIAQHDAARLANTAHKLLSSLGAIGAEAARKLALQLEEQAQRKEIDAAEATLADLARELAKVSEALEELSGVCV
jgi:HPt (histidine-containing phosphotransfer) domain-containing protein